MSSRRGFLTNFLGIGAAALSTPSLFGQKAPTTAEAVRHPHHAQAGAGSNIPVQTPDVPDLPFMTEGGVKVFHLVAEPVNRGAPPPARGSRATSCRTTLALCGSGRLRRIAGSRPGSKTALLRLTT